MFQIVDDILDVTGDEAELGQAARIGRAPRQADLRQRVRPRPGPRACPGVALPGALSARRDRRDDRQARADRRLHPHPTDMTDTPSHCSRRSTAPRTSRVSTTSSCSRWRRRCVSRSSTRSVRSAVTSAPTSGRARSPWRSTRCSNPRATRCCGTSATRPTRTRSSPAAATGSRRSAPTAGSRRSARSPSPSTTSWVPAMRRLPCRTRSASRRRCAAATATTARSSR